jgi:hypothetical protein
VAQNRLRVIHCGTGATGIEGLLTIIRHPQMELVGQYVASADKVGVDCGVLAGAGPIGVKATNDWAQLLALDADCLSYMGNGAGREDEVVAEICAFLERGTDAVTISLIPMVYPQAAPDGMREKIEKACAKGGSTFYASGIDPGFATTHLPVALASIAGRIESVRMLEISVYGDYPVVPIMTEIFGFGRPLDFDRPMFQGGAASWWGGTVRAVAAEIGIVLDEIRPVYEVAAHTSDIETTFGTVPAGTTAGVRFQVEGLVQGRPVVTLEHVSRASADVAPNWPVPTHEIDHQYRVEFTGDPSFHCMMDSPSVREGLCWTANHVANAIPAVLAAEPGVKGPFDLPRYHGTFTGSR